MVTERVTDGRRIAELLSSEVHGHERGALGQLSVVDAARDVEPTEFGAFAYGIDLTPESTPTEGAPTIRLADIFVHPHRARVEFRTGVAATASAAEEAGLRVRRKAVSPSRTLVFVESGAAVKRALSVLNAAVEAAETDADADAES